MANNPYVNKVVYDGRTLIDISDTTATASDCVSGKYLHLASGQKVEGSASGGSYITQDAEGYVEIPPVNGTATTTTKSITKNGVYNASSDGATGYSQVTVNTAGINIVTKTKYATATSISFTGLSDEPKAFFVSPNTGTSLPSSGNYSKYIVSVRYNGIDINSSYRNNGSVRLISTSDVSFTYSNGTLNVSCSDSAIYFDGTYKLTYIY